MDSENVIGAFSEEQASAISGLSPYQLRQWSREGIFHPAFEVEEKGVPYGRLYSFRDLVSLQVLDDLRNRKRVPLSHLRKVAERLAHLGDRRWIATTLYVLGRRVVFDNPRTKQREEVVSGQRVFNIPLRVVARNTREKIQQLNDRSSKIGKFERNRFVSSNRRVFSGTRIPVDGVIEFLAAGYHSDQILREFPDLTETDLNAAKQESRAA
jgi:DNA-binding transcriptional MerR regulator